MVNLMKMLEQGGYPRDQMFHHHSDLYVFVTPLTTKILEEWCEANGWDKNLVKQKSFLFGTFTDQITGKLMYDIAFQYTDYWEEESKRGVCEKDV